MLTEHEKHVLRDEVAQMEYKSFPNGSAYYQQTLENGVHHTSIGDVKVELRYNRCYKVTFPYGVREVRLIWDDEPSGSGVNYGACYCSRNQVLVDLL